MLALFLYLWLNHRVNGVPVAGGTIVSEFPVNGYASVAFDYEITVRDKGQSQQGGWPLEDRAVGHHGEKIPKTTNLMETIVNS